MIKLWWQWEDLLAYLKLYYSKEIYTKWYNFVPRYELNSNFIHNKKEDIQLFYNIYECSTKHVIKDIFNFAIKKFIEDLLYVETTTNIIEGNYITFPKNGCALFIVENASYSTYTNIKDVITLASAVRIYQ